MTRVVKSVAAVVAALGLVTSAPVAWADEVDAEEIIVGEAAPPPKSAVAEDEGASALAIIVDLVIGRPTLLMAGLAGAAFYVISLPVTLPSGTEPDAHDTFILPGKQLVGTPLGGKLDPAG